MKQITLSILILLLTVVTVDAQRSHSKMKKNPEAKAAMDELHLQEIVPVMTAVQAEFDQQLSIEDRKFIQAKRVEAEQHRKKHMELMKGLKSAKEDGMSKENMRERRNALRKEMHQTRKATAESLTAFMERNKALIESTMEEMKPKHEEWMAKRKAIHEKYKPEGAPKMKHQKRGDHPPHHEDMEEGHKRASDSRQGLKGDNSEVKRHHGKRGGKGHGDPKYRHAVKFLLWNAKGVEADTRSGDVGKLLPNLEQNYPNPANSTTTVEFTLPQSANNVELTITNTNGQLVERKTFEQLEKGEHQYEFNVTDLPRGTYFYSIKAGEYRASKKMMVVE